MVGHHRRSFECRYCGSSFKFHHSNASHATNNSNRWVNSKRIGANVQLHAIEYHENRNRSGSRAQHSKMCYLPLFIRSLQNHGWDECIFNIDADDADTQFNLTVKPNAIIAGRFSQAQQGVSAAFNQSSYERYRYTECNVKFARKMIEWNTKRRYPRNSIVTKNFKRKVVQ